MVSFSDVGPKAISGKPLGLHLVHCIRKNVLSSKAYQALVLSLTFFAYASYHATRKTTSIVKGVLDPKSGQLGFSHWRRSYLLKSQQLDQQNSELKHGWAPFDGVDGSAMLGEIDVAFLLFMHLACTLLATWATV
ncbi:hypothetical protein HPP92_025642 [Vanilla planifolia]|uniref:Uncharacterized protein n=1 Tax=Vanilla planifolia TaxID=51239 RepID=A0A835U972_VANPL|nr:hypothetical protein HPP92_025642 [Vanilla planifolia]